MTNEEIVDTLKEMYSVHCYILKALQTANDVFMDIDARLKRLEGDVSYISKNDPLNILKRITDKVEKIYE